MLELFLNRGCNIEAVNHNAYTALHKAAATGSIPAVRALIKRGANIRFVFSEDFCYLMLFQGDDQ